MRVGRFEVLSVVSGTIRLDGGAMYGVVPKVVWQQHEDVDELNRILLAMRTLVALDRESGRVLLVDTGAGSKWEPDEAERYEVTSYPLAIEEALGRLGLAARDVTDVVVTHAHFDHCGGLTDWKDGQAGKANVHFPRARHWIHERQWMHATEPFDKDAASFLQRDLMALEEAGALAFVRGDDPEPPFAGVRWVVSNGHTPGQLLPLFEDERSPLLFAGDMIPTSAHLPPLWVMAYDLQPLVTIEEKRKVLARCLDEGLVLAFPHDMRMGGARIDASGKKPKVASPLSLDP